MKIATYFGNFKMLFWGIATATLAFSANVTANTNETFVSQDILAYGFTMTSLQGNDEVDPNKVITLEAVGLGSLLSKVELIDEAGKILFESKNQSRLSLPTPLAFATHYTIKVTTERSLLEQVDYREIHFTTVVVPQLQGSLSRMLDADASVTLHFDRPVGDVQVKSDLALKVESDASKQNIRLLASAYGQNQRYPVQLSYQTATGVLLPSLSLELQTPPPITAVTNVHGLTNLGLVLPLQVTFSEPLAKQENWANSLYVETLDGKAISGKWRKQGDRQVKFTPQPGWPAESTIKVSADQQNLKSERGGRLNQAMIEQFSTGTDRKLFVYLDSQRVEAVENGKVIRTFKVSTGKSKTPTVTGSYYIYDRYRHKTMRSDVNQGQPGYYEVKDVPYTQFFHKDYAFHGAFWHNGFGQPASHGCVNLATKEQNKRWPNVSEDAGWLYQWGALGLPVIVMQKTTKPLAAGSQPSKASKPVYEKIAKVPQVAAR